MRSGVGRGEHIELRQRRHLISERNFLAVAQIADCAREWSYLSRLREQADEVWNSELLANARPERFYAAGITLLAGEYGPSQILGGILGVVGIVSSTDFCLVRQNENVAQATELLRDWRNVVVADQNVLVFFLDQLISGRNNHFHHVFARRKHGSAICGVRHANRTVAASHRSRRAVGSAGSSWRTTNRISGDNAGKVVHAVVWSRLHLVPVVHAVIALELRVIRKAMRRHARMVVDIEPHWLVEQCEEEEIGIGAGSRALARAVHVGYAVSAEALRPIVEAAGFRRVDQVQFLAAIGGSAFLIEI